MFTRAGIAADDPEILARRPVPAGRERVFDQAHRDEPRELAPFLRDAPAHASSVTATETLHKKVLTSTDERNKIRTNTEQNQMGSELPTSKRVGGSSDGRMGHAELAQAIIADCEGDARAAVLAMVRINSALMMELEALTGMRAQESGKGGPH
jgi:hypothetical protein